MIKRAAAAILILNIFIILCSCTQKSPYTDIRMFKSKVNKSFDSEVFNNDEIMMIKKNNDNVYYLRPADKNDTCVVIYQDETTSILIKYNLVFSCKKEYADTDFINKITNAVTDNNKYIRIREFEGDCFYIIKYEDKRYIKESDEPVLKKNINENDLY